jgi:hypothetical protein
VIGRRAARARGAAVISSPDLGVFTGKDADGTFGLSAVALSASRELGRMVESALLLALA